MLAIISRSFNSHLDVGLGTSYRKIGHGPLHLGHKINMASEALTCATSGSGVSAGVRIPIGRCLAPSITPLGLDMFTFVNRFMSIVNLLQTSSLDTPPSPYVDAASRLVNPNAQM